MLLIEVRVGRSLTAAVDTTTCTALADSPATSSCATTVKALRLPFVLLAGVQKALLLASIVSLLPAAQAVAVPAVAPILSVPVETVCTTKPVTEPSPSASFPAEVRSEKLISFSVSSVPPVILLMEVRVGRSLTAAVETTTCTALADSALESSSATTVKAFRLPLASAAGVQKALLVELIVSLLPATQAVAVPTDAPIFRVPVDTAFTTKPFTKPSLSASLPAVVRSEKLISFSVSSVPPVILLMEVRIGASLTAAVSTTTCTALADSAPTLSSATTVKALRLPLALLAGVQNALLLASMVSLLPAAQAVAVPAVAPILRVPVETAFTTKPVTEPSLSASLPAAVKSEKLISFSVSSVPPVILLIIVSVGLAFETASSS